MSPDLCKLMYTPIYSCRKTWSIGEKQCGNKVETYGRLHSKTPYQKSEKKGVDYMLVFYHIKMSDVYFSMTVQ